MTLHTLRLLERSPGFERVTDRVRAEEELWNPDTTLPVRDLTATPHGTLWVPDVGEVKPTPWSRRQLATELGIQWNRWFENVSGSEASEEINRRFRRSEKQWKVRTRRARPDESADPEVGILGALVSPTYTPIATTRVLNGLSQAFPGSATSRLVAWRTDFTDRSLHLSFLDTKPVSLGSGSMKETYYVGFHLRNSSVGFTALTLHVFFLRLACTNGMLICEGLFRRLYRTHRPIDDVKLHQHLEQAFSGIGEVWQHGLSLLDASRRRNLVNLELTLTSLLRKVPGLMAYRKAITAELLSSSTAPSVFDLAQALTHVAKSADPEPRFDLERLAGNLLLEDDSNEESPKIAMGRTQSTPETTTQRMD